VAVFDARGLHGHATAWPCHPALKVKDMPRVAIQPALLGVLICPALP